MVSESSRLHLDACVTSIVCRCVVLNSLKMHFRVILKHYLIDVGERLPGSVNRAAWRHLWVLPSPPRPGRGGVLSETISELICDHLSAEVPWPPGQLRFPFLKIHFVMSVGRECHSYSMYCTLFGCFSYEENYSEYLNLNYVLVFLGDRLAGNLENFTFFKLNSFRRPL